jgi:Flp pilus assembly protein TadG
MVEFAIVAPLFMILLLIILDFGKALYVKNTLDSAAREAARAAVVLTPTYCTSGDHPTACDAEKAAQTHSSDVFLANPSPFCTAAAPSSGNTGLIYISRTYAPGGETAGSVSCPDGTKPVMPASGHKPITITIEYCYKPMVPLLSSVLALATSGNCSGGITLVSQATMQSEY